MDKISDIYHDAMADPTLLSMIDVDKLLEKIEGEENHYLENKTLAKISKDIFDAIAELNVDTELAQYYCRHLAGHRYVERICDLKNGKHTRWIRRPTSSKTSDMMDKKSLTNGGLLVNVKIENSGVHLLCRRAMNRIFTVKFDDCLIFQKLSMEEQLVIMSYDYIENDDSSTK